MATIKRKKRSEKAADALQDRFRALCGEITPGKRLTVILTVLAVCTAVNLYITFKAIYNLGRDSQKGSIPAAMHIGQPEITRSGNEPGVRDSVKGKGGLP